jgi:glycosyltransferase involved in cell wall biosynthesis
VKILCITGGFLPSIGGMQFSTNQTLLGLSELGVDITLVCPHENGDVEFDKVNPYKIIRSGDGGYLTEIKNLFLVNKLYKNDNFDEVMIMGHFGEVVFGIFKNFFSFTPIILAAGTRLPFENDKYKMIIRNSILCRAYNGAKKIIAISDATINYIQDYCNTPVYRFKKIPRPIDDNIWQFKEKVKHDSFTLVTFSRFEEQKNIQEVLEILSKVKQKGYKFKYILIGDGEYKNELLSLPEKLNLQDEIEFLGFKPQNEVANILLKCDLNILLSKANNGAGESFGRIYPEAGFIKVPSIGYRTSGTIEAIKDNYSGFLYNYGELDEIENKIIELLTNKDLLNKLSEQTYLFSKNTFAKSIVAKQIKDFIND